MGVAHPKFHGENIRQMVLKLWNSRKLSPSKVSHQSTCITIVLQLYVPCICMEDRCIINWAHVICWHLLSVPTATSLLISSQMIFIYLQHPHTSTWCTLHIHLQCAQCYIHVQCICTCTWICTWNMEKSVIETLHVASSHGWRKCQSRLKRKCPYSTEVHTCTYTCTCICTCVALFTCTVNHEHGFHIQNISWGIIHAVYKPATYMYMSTVKILWIHSISLMN